MRLLINNTEESFILVDKNLEIISLNNQFKKLYQEYFQLEVQKGVSILNYSQTGSKETLKQLYNRVLSGKTERSELTIKTQNSQSKYFSIKYSPALNESNEIIGVFVTAADVTEKKKAEEQKEFERRDKEALINSTEDMIWSVSSDYRLIAANKSFHSMN